MRTSSIDCDAATLLSKYARLASSSSAREPGASQYHLLRACTKASDWVRDRLVRLLMRELAPTPPLPLLSCWPAKNSLRALAASTAVVSTAGGHCWGCTRPTCHLFVVGREREATAATLVRSGPYLAKLLCQQHDVIKHIS